MNYRSLTDGEKDVEESPSQCGPDQLDLASLARLAVNPFFLQIQVSTENVSLCSTPLEQSARKFVSEN